MDKAVDAIYGPDMAVHRAIGYDCSPADNNRFAHAQGKTQGRKGDVFIYPLQQWGWHRIECERQIRAAGLPVPQVDITDPAAGYLATLGTLDPAQITATLSAAVHGEAGTPPAVAESAETRLALARAFIVTGALGDAEKTLAELAAQDSTDWRITWYQGLRELVSGQPGEAQAAFDAVYDALPGELAPQVRPRPRRHWPTRLRRPRWQRRR